MGIVDKYLKREKELQKAKKKIEPFKNFRFLTREYLILQKKR